MEPEHKAQLLKILTPLLSPFGSYSGGEAADAITGYLIALSDIPIPFVGQAARAFLSGTVADFNPKFAPTPAELSKEARRLWSRQLDDERRQRERALQIEGRSTPLTAEELARRSAQVEEAKARLAANGTGKPRRFDDLTEEQARAKLDETLASLDKTRHYEIVSPSLQEQIATAQHERTGE